jgi:ParB family chromosome partitioning protein
MRFKVPVQDADAITDLIEKIMTDQNFTEADSLTNAGDALVWLSQEYSNE